MPPMKRKAVGIASEPQSEKRVTRSSTIEDEGLKPQTTGSSLPNVQAPKTSSTKTNANPPKNPRTGSSTAKQSKNQSYNNATLKKTRGKESASETEHPAPQDVDSSTSFTTVTITSDLIKNPIQCHSYPGLDPTTSPTLIFTHGAGGDCSAAAVVNFCTGFSTKYPILAFNGSMNLASRAKGFYACIENLSTTQDGQGRLLLGGRSMGSRAAVMAASELLANDTKTKTEVSLILASYPLQGPKDVRDQIMLDLPSNVRVLFVIGDRDAMCPLDMLEGVRKKMKAGNQLVVVRGADHGMHVRPKKRESEVVEETGRVVAEWVGGKVREDVVCVGEEEDDDG